MGTAEFRRLDATDPEAVRALRDQVGAAGVHLRTVIHQSEPPARQGAADAVVAPVGRRRQALVAHLLPELRGVLTRTATGGDGPPPTLERVLRHGPRPAEAADHTVPQLREAAGLPVPGRGRSDPVVTEQDADGRRIDLAVLRLAVGRDG